MIPERPTLCALAHQTPSGLILFQLGELEAQLVRSLKLFVTLSFLPLILHIGTVLGRGGVSLTCFAALLMIVYQVILSSTHLEAFLLSDDRASDFISQNKEGIFSLIGYTAIYLHAAHLGSLNNPVAKRRELIRTALGTLVL